MNLTLDIYIARRFLGIAASAFVAVFLLVATVDLVELMRSSGDSQAALPYVIQSLFYSFGCFFMVFFLFMRLQMRIRGKQ